MTSHITHITQVKGHSPVIGSMMVPLIKVLNMEELS